MDGLYHINLAYNIHLEASKNINRKWSCGWGVDLDGVAGFVWEYGCLMSPTPYFFGATSKLYSILVLIVELCKHILAS